MKTTSAAACGVLAALLDSTIFACAANAAVVISSGETTNISCSGGICAPTAKDAVLNVGDLETLLASGNVEITTTGAGVQAVDVRVVDSLTWSSMGTLALDAYKSIAVDAAVSVVGAGGLSLITNDGGSNGTLSFGKKGHATFANLSSPLVIDGTSYTLVNSIKSLARAVAKNPSGDYALAGDYDAKKDSTYSAAPVSGTFNGTFEGLGNTISKLSVFDSTQSDYVGLFAQIGDSGTVANLRLADVAVTGDAKASLRRGGEQFVGGLAGETAGTLLEDSVSGTVAGGKLAEVGGLVGYLGIEAGAIVNSHSIAHVEGGLMASVGGLAGGSQVQTTAIANSYAAGNVEVGSGDWRKQPKGAWAGGLVGSLGGKISDSFATGNVTGGQFSLLGGLAGEVGVGLVHDNYATGVVKGGAHAAVGGLVGEDVYSNGSDELSDSYSAGAVSGGTESEVGGFAGVVQNSGTAKHDCWDTTTSGTDTGVGEGSDADIAGLTTTQLQSGLPKGFSAKIWGENAAINNGLPYLLANPPPK